MKRITAVVILALVLASSCVSLSVKQKASNIRQSVHAALVTLDDIERQLCQPVPTAVNTCGAVPRVITDANHQAFSRTMAQAFDADIKAGNAIIALVPDSPIPPELINLKAMADRVFAVAQSIATGPRASEILAQARAVVQMVADLLSAFEKEELAWTR